MEMGGFSGAEREEGIELRTSKIQIGHCNGKDLRKRKEREDEDPPLQSYGK